MAVLKRAHGPRGHRPQVAFYGCMTRHLRGDAVCNNALEVRLDDADEAVLTAVEKNVLNIAVLETSLYKAMEAIELAKRAKVTRVYIAALEAGHKTNPSIAILKKLARALGVPVGELLE
jgi:DNA-binding XRE family transcriptional regulator